MSFNVYYWYTGGDNMTISKTNSTVVKSRHDNNSKFGSGVKVTSEAVRFVRQVEIGTGDGCSSSKPPVGCGSSIQVKINK